MTWVGNTKCHTNHYTLSTQARFKALYLCLGSRSISSLIRHLELLLRFSSIPSRLALILFNTQHQVLKLDKDHCK